MQIDQDGIDFIKQQEGVRYRPYRDSVGLWTFGVGHLIGNGKEVLPPFSDYSKENPAPSSVVDQYLEYDLQTVEQALNGLLKVEVTQNQFNALCSLGFNIGVGGLHHASVIGSLNAGDPIYQAADAFLLWNKAGGRFSQALEDRRERERALFLIPDSPSTGHSEGQA